MKTQATRRQSSVSRPPAPQSCPWLVFSHGKRSNTQTFYSIPEDRYYVKKIPEMSQKYICASSHGWMVMLDWHSDECFLLNPISMEKIKLPPWGSFTYEYCVLSSPPTDPNCIIAFILSKRPRIMLCFPGEKEWIEREFGSENDILDCVICDGKIYCLRNYEELVRFDVGANRSLDMRKLGAKNKLTLSSLLPEVVRFGSYLIESCGEIFLVSMLILGEEIMIKVRDVEVFKLDLGNLDWVKVECLGDRAFFINERSNCISCSATKSGIKGNSIYFIWGDEDKSMYVFDMETCSIYVTLPCPNVVHNCLETAWVCA